MLGLQQCLRPLGRCQKQLHAVRADGTAVRQHGAPWTQHCAALLLCVQGLRALPQSLLNQIGHSPKEEKSENLLDILKGKLSAT